MVTGELNIHLLDPIIDDENYFSHLKDTFAFTNLVKNKTYELLSKDCYW